MARLTLKSFARRFRDDDDGAATLEFAIMMPVLFWAFMAVFTFFDGYRQSAMNLKAAYTIGDILSRETNTIDSSYITTLYNLHQTMTRAGSESWLRITVVRWDDEDKRYYRDWSKARGGITEQDNITLSEVADRLPVMPDDERVILVETGNTWTPMFNIGLDDIELDNFIFTRPRFAPQLCWEQC